MAQFLLNTEDQILVEASPADRIWGIGMAQDHKDAPYPWNWKGLNLLGYALMEVRTLLAGLEADGPLNNPVLPPWLAYPEIARYSIGWRMGSGEGHILELGDYLETLSPNQQKVYEIFFPARGEWIGWYKD